MVEGLARVKQDVEEAGGVLTIEMERLRDAYGVERLGTNVRDNIAKELAGMGIGHLPRKLPAYQEDEVRLYRLGSAIADLIEAVLKPSVSGDELLRSTVSEGAEAILRKIREIIEGE